MDILTDKKEISSFLADMQRGFADPANWQHWYALNFSAAKPLSWTDQGKVTSLLRVLYPDNEGSILWTPGSVLCMIRVEGEFDLSTFAQKLYDLEDMPRVTLRMLCVDREAEAFRGLLERYTIPALAVPSEQVGNFMMLKKMIPDIEERLRAWHRVKHGRKGRSRPVLMVVDDDEMMRTLVQHVLGKTHTVITASNGREALDKHLNEAPDILFLDIGLPDCSGLSLLNYIHQYDSDCQIVIFTSDTYLKTQVKALAAGADGFVGKPFKPAEFESHIARWSPPEQKNKPPQT